MFLSHKAHTVDKPWVALNTKGRQPKTEEGSSNSMGQISSTEQML